MQSRNSKLILCPFCFFDKIDSPFCLQNCFFLLAAHFAQILLSKFCQGLSWTCIKGGNISVIWHNRNTHGTSFIFAKMLYIRITRITIKLSGSCTMLVYNMQWHCTNIITKVTCTATLHGVGFRKILGLSLLYYYS